ncbi:MAG: NAD(P)H-quinone oxidoreductase [Pseudomonadota bacterium]
MAQAVCIQNPGGPEQLVPAEIPVPQPQAGEVQIAVHAAGVNRPDCLQRAGKYPVPADASPLPGLEVAGRVSALGDSVSNFAIDDPVCALVHGGGYAEYCTVDARHVLPVPSGFSFQEAAALPETLFTVYYNVLERCALRAGEVLLVHGGSSGIGTTAIQLGRAIGARVVTTAGSDEKCRYCEQHGATLAINYRTAVFAEVVKRELGEVDVVLDMVAGDYVQPNLDLLRRDGRYALIAFLRGPQATLNLGPILRKRLTLTGSTLRPQSADEKAAIASGIRRDIWAHVEAGQIRPPVYAEFPLAHAADAHRLMESSEHMGKIVLTTALAGETA